MWCIAVNAGSGNKITWPSGIIPCVAETPRRAELPGAFRLVPTVPPVGQGTWARAEFRLQFSDLSTLHDSSKPFRRSNDNRQFWTSREEKTLPSYKRVQGRFLSCDIQLSRRLLHRHERLSILCQGISVQRKWRQVYETQDTSSRGEVEGSGEGYELYLRVAGTISEQAEHVSYQKKIKSISC